MRANTPKTPVTFYTTEKPVESNTPYGDSIQKLFRGRSNVWIQRPPRKNALDLWKTTSETSKVSEGRQEPEIPHTPRTMSPDIFETADEATYDSESARDLKLQHTPQNNVLRSQRAASDGPEEAVKESNGCRVRDCRSF